MQQQNVKEFARPFIIKLLLVGPYTECIEESTILAR